MDWKLLLECAKEILGSIFNRILLIAGYMLSLSMSSMIALFGGGIVFGTFEYWTQILTGYIMFIGGIMMFICILIEAYYKFRQNDIKVKNFDYWAAVILMNIIFGMMTVLPWHFIITGQMSHLGIHVPIIMASLMTFLYISMLIGSVMRKKWANPLKSYR